VRGCGRAIRLPGRDVRGGWRPGVDWRYVAGRWVLRGSVGVLVRDEEGAESAAGWALRRCGAGRVRRSTSGRVGAREVARWGWWLGQSYQSGASDEAVPAFTLGSGESGGRCARESAGANQLREGLCGSLRRSRSVPAPKWNGSFSALQWILVRVLPRITSAVSPLLALVRAASYPSCSDYHARKPSERYACKGSVDGLPPLGADAIRFMPAFESLGAGDGPAGGNPVHGRIG